MNFLASLLFPHPKSGTSGHQFFWPPFNKTRGRQWRVNLNFSNTYFETKLLLPVNYLVKKSFNLFFSLLLSRFRQLKKYIKWRDNQLNKKVFLKKLSTSYKNLISSAWEWEPADTSGSRKSAHSVKLTKL